MSDALTPEQYRALNEPKRHKFNAQHKIVDGHRFPSIKQANRYAELKKLESGGIIRNLRCEVIFQFFKGHFCFATWRVDYTYDEEDKGMWIPTAEDPTGAMTNEKRAKIRMFQRHYPTWRLKIT